MRTSRLKVIYRPALLILWLLIISTSVFAIPFKNVNDSMLKPTFELAEQTEEMGIDKADVPFQQPYSIQTKDSAWPWWYWAIGIAALGVMGSVLSDGGGSSSNSNSGSGSSCPSGSGTCGSTTITW